MKFLRRIFKIEEEPEPEEIEVVTKLPPPDPTLFDEDLDAS